MYPSMEIWPINDLSSLIKGLGESITEVKGNNFKSNCQSWNI